MASCNVQEAKPSGHEGHISWCASRTRTVDHSLSSHKASVSVVVSVGELVVWPAGHLHMNDMHSLSLDGI